MKNTILTMVIVTLAAANSYSQSETPTTDKREQLHLGLKAGANYSNVYDSKGEDFVADAKFGLVGGAFISIPFGKYFGIQPEVIFSQKGYKALGTFLGSTYSMTRTTDYIDVPLLLVIKPIENISIVFGPQYSYLLKQKDAFNGGTITSSQEQIYINDNIRKNTFCLTGGLDLNMNHIILGLRTGWDMKNNNGDGTSTTPRYKNVWYQTTLGFRF